MVSSGGSETVRSDGGRTVTQSTWFPEHMVPIQKVLGSIPGSDASGWKSLSEILESCFILSV